MDAKLSIHRVRMMRPGVQRAQSVLWVFDLIPPHPLRPWSRLPYPPTPLWPTRCDITAEWKRLHCASGVATWDSASRPGYLARCPGPKRLGPQARIRSATSVITQSASGRTTTAANRPGSLEKYVSCLPKRPASRYRAVSGLPAPVDIRTIPTGAMAWAGVPCTARGTKEEVQT